MPNWKAFEKKIPEIQKAKMKKCLKANLENT
jgi:hypothetical protein